MSYQNIARIIPTIQSAQLVGSLASKKKKKKKKLLGDATNILVGVPLIQAEAGMVGLL